MPKKPSQGSEFSKERETRVLLEEIRSQFRQFGEGQTDMQEKVAHIPSIIDRIEKLDGRVMMLDLAFSSIRKDISILKSDVALIKASQATKKDLEEFNKRLTTVESR